MHTSKPCWGDRLSRPSSKHDHDLHLHKAAVSIKGDILTAWHGLCASTADGVLTLMQAAFKEQVLTTTGPCIRLEQPLCSFINRVQRLFFLNEAQNLSSFLIADLGVAKYPSYTVRRSRSVFTSRQHLLDYEKALEHAAELDNALEVSSQWSQL